jgi:hypothetical protein
VKCWTWYRLLRYFLLLPLFEKLRDTYITFMVVQSKSIDFKTMEESPLDRL